MNRNLFKIAIVIALLLMAGRAFAQNSGIYGYTVPFAFQAGTVKLPAGNYVVRVPSSAKGLICLEGADGTRYAMLLTLPFSKEANYASAKLVFNRYGNTYFLSQVWECGETGQELMKSKVEKEYVQQARIPKTIDVAFSKAK